MKEIDFLPEWYKESRRKRSHMRRQYVALTVVFLAMLSYNLTSEHRIATANARVSRVAEEQVQAEVVMAEFKQISQTLSQQKARAEVVQRADSRIDADAVLAEISHVINDHVILNRLEFISEPVEPADKKKSQNGGSAVRAANRAEAAGQTGPLGDVRFRVVLAGVAADPEDVSTLLGKLDESPYFKRVTPTFSKPGKLSLAPRGSYNTTGVLTRIPAGGMSDTYQVTDFEITCYLANFEEIQG